MKTYEDSGVSVKKNDQLVDMIRNETGISTGFSDCQPIPNTDLIMVQCSDGVGTKIHYALDYPDLYKTIGQDLVAMCVNDLICAGAQPLWFQDYIGMNSLNQKVINQIIKSINDACEIGGVKLTGGEMAEMPGTYATETPELVGFASGIATEETRINKDDVKVDDYIIGLPSSGFHSNGFSLIRQVFNKPFSAYEESFAMRLLTPTELYYKVSEIHQDNPRLIHSMAHITGGGLEDNIARAIPNHLKVDINYNSWDIPELFHRLHTDGDIETESMWATFNMGVGMCLIVSDFHIDDVMAALNGHHSAFVLGNVINK